MSEYPPQHTDALAQESYRAPEPENKRAHKIANGVLIAILSIIVLSLLVIGFSYYESYRIEQEERAFEETKSTVLWDEEIVTAGQGRNSTVTEITFSSTEASDLDAVANHLAEVGPSFGEASMGRLNINWPQGRVTVLSPSGAQFVSASDWRLILQYAQDSRVEKIYLSGNSLIFDLKAGNDSVESFSNDFADLPLPVNVNKAVMQAEYSSPQGKNEYNINVYARHAPEGYKIAEEIAGWADRHSEQMEVTISSKDSPYFDGNFVQPVVEETDYRVAQIEINIKDNLVDTSESRIDTAAVDEVAQSIIQYLKDQGYTTNIATVTLSTDRHSYHYDYATEQQVSEHG